MVNNISLNSSKELIGFASLIQAQNEYLFKTGNYDSSFLQKLDKQKVKIIYARIIALSQDDKPLEVIEGRVTGGSINIDGTSAVRRTCSLTMVGEDLRFTNYLWSFKQKFKLEIGLENTVDNNYPSIVWFNQGIYLVNTFSHSKSTNNISINIQGKDKMAKLDGTMGGILTAQTDFGSYDEIAPDGTITTIPIPIYQIVQNLLHQLVGEPFHNIVITDLAEYGYELWDYRGETQSPMYYFYKADTEEVINFTFDGDKKVYNESKKQWFTLKELTNEDLYNRNDLSSNGNIFKLTEGGSIYKIAKIEYGETAGYHKTQLTYNGELKGNPGETYVAILDKIKNMLGEFEYFYDLMGRFIFQKKRTYVQNLFTPLRDNYIETFSAMEKYSYKFEDEELVISCSDNPALSEVKNDFTIWGTNSSNNSIHARFAIDHKPIEYRPFPHYKRIYLTYLEDTEDAAAARYVKTQEGYELSTNQKIGVKKIKTNFKPSNNNILYEEVNNNFIKYKDQVLYILNEDHEFIKLKKKELDLNQFTELYILEEDTPSRPITSSDVDWRELIYLMARDYYQHNQNPEYELKLRKLNPWCKNGKTGYEQYYTDMQGFWRLLYKPKPQHEPMEIWPKNKEALEKTSYLQITMANKNKVFDVEEQKNLYTIVEKQRDVKIDNKIEKESFYCLKRVIDCKETETQYGDWYYQLFTSSIGVEYSQLIEFFKDGQGDVKPIIENNLTINIAELDKDGKEIIKSDPIKIFIKDSKYITNATDKYYGWLKEAIYSPEQLIFWFDFLDTRGELDAFSVPSIGIRSKVDNNKSVKTIYNKEIPEVEFVIMPQEHYLLNTQGSLALQQMRLQDELRQMFNISSSGLSAAARADELINKHACMTNGISLTTIPIYYLEPNTRIYVKNEELQIDGDYIVSKLTIPLTYNGTMSINATKVIEQLK